LLKILAFLCFCNLFDDFGLLAGWLAGWILDWPPAALLEGCWMDAASTKLMWDDSTLQLLPNSFFLPDSRIQQQPYFLHPTSRLFLRFYTGTDNTHSRVK
jgi:hypothetical protein